MRRVVAFIILLLSLGIFLTAINRGFINRIKQDRYFDHLDANVQNDPSLYHRLFIRSDRWAYGDLYGECYLPQYKLKLAPFKKYTYNHNKPLTDKILYIIGDSFLADKTLTSAFKEFDNVIYLDRRFAFGPIVIDSTKQNYLLLEFAERNLNQYALESTQEQLWTSADIKAKYNFGVPHKAAPANAVLPESIFSRIDKVIFNKDISRNIELLLFDDRLFSPFKELKASLNYFLFRRLNKDVAVSTDKQRLLMNVTVDTSSIQSAFKPHSALYISNIVNNLNAAAAYYKTIGFKAVFLSVIPNPVSVYDQQGNYNHLLQKVEQHSPLPKIKVYDTYRSTPQNMYYLSDSHWNPLGFDTWIKQADNVFNNIH